MKIEEEIKQQKFRSAYQKAVINLLYTQVGYRASSKIFSSPSKLRRSSLIFFEF